MTLMFAVEGTTYREISEFRFALEYQALSLAVHHATEEQMAEMEYHMSMLETARRKMYAQNTIKEFIICSLRLHITTILLLIF